MDSESLRTASEYLNNLLLARGLLRNGDPIDFVKPSRESRAQIINLVHDLILRGDRDKEQRERTAQAYRQLRAEEDSKTAETERWRTKQEETARATAQAQAAERIAKDELKKVERSMRTLQEQTNKLKTTLAQVKAQCNTDIKKRDLELARLKTHLQGQQRGNRSATVAPGMTVTGSARRPAFDSSARDVADPAYSLKQESNEFLTQLSQDLSEENERLLNIVRGAVITLQELLGIQVALRGNGDSGIGEDVTASRFGDKKLSSDFDDLANDLDSTLTHLKSLLTNPNFVSIEEVEVREEEIIRMRADWVKMEERWHALLDMMKSWRRRMDVGDIISKEDLRKGMGLVSPSHEHTEPTISRISQPTIEDNSLLDDSIDDIRANKSSGGIEQSQQHQRQPHSNGHLVSKLPTVKSRTTSSQHTSQDQGRASPKRKRDPLEPPESFDLRPRERASCAGASRQASVLDILGDESSEELEIPRMTISEKLSAVADEAAAARHDDHHDAAEDDSLGTLKSAKGKITGKPRRRKSTLSRDELAELLNAGE